MQDNRATAEAQQTPEVVLEKQDGGTPPASVSTNSQVLLSATPEAIAERKRREDVWDSLIEKIIAPLKPHWELKITDEQMKILRRPFSPEDIKQIQVKPNGKIPIIFLPWEWYAERMTEAFGFGWTLEVVTKPTIGPDGRTVIVLCILVINGHYAGRAWGECEFVPNNPRMTWGDAVEGAMSNALMRIIGKRVGIGRQLWNQEFIRRWVFENVIRIRFDGELLWIKRSHLEFYPGAVVVYSPQGSTTQKTTNPTDNATTPSTQKEVTTTPTTVTKSKMTAETPPQHDPQPTRFESPVLQNSTVLNEKRQKIVANIRQLCKKHNINGDAVLDALFPKKKLSTLTLPELGALLDEIEKQVKEKEVQRDFYGYPRRYNQQIEKQVKEKEVQRD